MLHRYAGEQRIVKGWEDKYAVPVFTSGMNQIRAMKALGAKRIVGAGYDSITGPIVEQYFRDAGFEVIAIEMMVDVFRRHPGGQVMYLQGSKWPSIDVIERLEARFDVPVVQAVAARCWEIQLRFDVGRPLAGYGQLLSEMPQG